jgi:ABC-type uncharacterized transport system permease subunit
MDNKVFGYFIFGGLLIGALFGLAWAGGDNPLMGIAIGAMVGVAIGWFAGAAFLEQRKKQK